MPRLITRNELVNRCLNSTEKIENFNEWQLGQEALDVSMERKWKKRAKRRHRTDQWSLEVN
jgi:hypothetical protein